MLLLRHVPGCHMRVIIASFGAAASAEATIRRTSRLFIDNEYVEAEGGATLSVVSPIDGEQFATIAHASASDVDRAVRRARSCFDESNWSKVEAEARAEVLRRIAAALRSPAKLAELSVIESRDCGKPLSESSADISFCADVLDYYAEEAPKHLAPKALPLPANEGGEGDFHARIQHEPVGVVGCITPWNYPLMQAVLKVAPALAVGCTVVLKPSPVASLTCCAFGELAVDAGVPRGALNVVTGGPPQELASGGSTGQSLIDHALLDKLSFTGSGVAGQKMLEASARRLRPTALELGGKSAFIVFEDAGEYLDAVVDWVMVGIFSCTGQVCSATSRLIVHRDLEQPLVERLVAAAAGIRVGDPLAEGTQMGPLASEAQRRRVLDVLSEAAASEHLSSGFYVPPTILTGVGTGSRAWREEIFGPVLCVRSFATEEEAVALANDTPYGLANSLYSSDPSRRARVASQLRSGVVWENCSQALFPSTPFGGRPGKASGFGHECG
eukprot:CAMPEP_0179200840 /NCGR_PEP_ID=MMETSP0796-20121207/99954_1 /TAXON_ID=73915 /ORGANISM="Pyrodinium bahamense, Strain pbaha01" /LENGTH=499 /DNA_ID=CAMNT_0020905397 /DNA_START=45 /DNA_END=1542 /DNA_ORIENTATION=-